MNTTLCFGFTLVLLLSACASQSGREVTLVEKKSSCAAIADDRIRDCHKQDVDDMVCQEDYQSAMAECEGQL